MPSSIVFGILLFLPALAYDDEFRQVMDRLAKMKDIQELFEEIPREGGRAVFTLGILHVLGHTENVERFLERNEEFASEFGEFGRTVVYLAGFYLSRPEIGPFARKVLDHGFEKFETWLQSISQQGLISYDAAEEPPTYVPLGDDLSTKDLREVLHLSFHKVAESPSGSITGGELHALVTAPTRLLAALCYVPADAEPAIIEKLLRSMRYSAAIFRLSFRQPDRMHIEDAERELVAEYIEESLRETRQGETSDVAAEILARIREWNRDREHHEL